MTNAVETALRRIVAQLLARDDETRPQDAGDLVALLPTLTDRDRAELRRVVTLITERGYDRGRDLPALTEEYLG